MSRHLNPVDPEQDRGRLAIAMAVPLALAVAGVIAAAIDVAPRPVLPAAHQLPTVDQADDTGARAARGFPTLVRPTIVPTDVTPWSEDDGPVAYYGQPLPTRTAAPATPAQVLEVPAATAAPEQPAPTATGAAVAIGLPPVYAPPTEPVEEPAPDDDEPVVDLPDLSIDLDPTTEPEPTQQPEVTP